MWGCENEKKGHTHAFFASVPWVVFLYFCSRFLSYPGNYACYRSSPQLQLSFFDLAAGVDLV